MTAAHLDPGGYLGLNVNCTNAEGFIRTIVRTPMLDGGRCGLLLRNFVSRSERSILDYEVRIKRSISMLGDIAYTSDHSK